MKKLFISLLVSTLVVGASFAQNTKEPTTQELKADLNFSPDIKVYGCILQLDETFIHIKDISSFSTIPFAKHDVRGILFINSDTKTHKSKNTVNNYNLFQKHFIPRWNECKYGNLEDKSKKVKSRSRNDDYYDY